MSANVFIRKYMTKNGETRYRLIVREFGKREKYICLGPITRKLAHKRRLQVLQELQTGTFQIEPTVNLFFGEFLDNYFLPWVKGNRALKTYQTYKEHIKPLKERLKGYRFSQIRWARDIEPHFTEWSASGRTKNLRLHVLRLAFSKAVELNFLLRSPVEGIKRFPESSIGSRALTPSQLAKLLDGLTTWQRSLVRVMVNSGLRPGEVMNLKFEDIDWEQNRLTVANDKTRKTKNRKSRFVPMNRDLREELEFLKQHLPLQGYSAKSEIGIRDYKPREAHQQEFVFCNADGSKVACIRRSLTRAFQKHGIEGVTPHGLRKTFCSLLARAKVHPRVAQQLMGHSKMDLTMRVYTEIDDGQLIEAVQSIPSLMEEKHRLQLVQGGNLS